MRIKVRRKDDPLIGKGAFAYLYTYKFIYMLLAHASLYLYTRYIDGLICFRVTPAYPSSQER